MRGAFGKSSWAGGVVLLAGALASCTEQAPPTSMNLRELNIVDAQGQTRVRIGAPLPGPRAAPGYGLQFLGPSGQEMGGIGMLDERGFHGLCFDSAEGYEAVCVSTIHGRPSIQLRSNDGNSPQERITLGVNESGVATVEIRDAAGKTQVRLEVGKDGHTRIEGVSPPLTSHAP
ncbi:hypothetical protein BHS07_07265 [Myxococcus xanthus]|uniref:Lipoprotein n=2 Tax=Myxococcus xanthus TaxID=34 RepID=A0AAE6KR71_MYXXA|nr:hypothetical protein BHS09_07370 [Myxococcus xanthus]QDE74119.1 hypothetical protein BHS08_07375 [Myxococcus xanthus]QDE81384.1 hypothetical protein BHS07_07265 [Myxococcus xanthus]QDE95714.1 hypothetical protein BHS05_07385 [Myxococcus xanthus]QDF03018.1 hypothetical protein BHS04_07275 [Myxococcus xanthus]